MLFSNKQRAGLAQRRQLWPAIWRTAQSLGSYKKCGLSSIELPPIMTSEYMEKTDSAGLNQKHKVEVPQFISWLQKELSPLQLVYLEHQCNVFHMNVNQV